MVAYMQRRSIGGWTHTFTSDNKIGWCWISEIVCREREERKEEGRSVINASYIRTLMKHA
jgi:hypothetical protein